jgi:hypothetical protein
MWPASRNMFTHRRRAPRRCHVRFVAFNMLDAPCFAAMGTIRRQMDDPKWFWFAIGYECGFGWVVGLIINQFWELAVLGNFGFWTVVAFVCSPSCCSSSSARCPTTTTRTTRSYPTNRIRAVGTSSPAGGPSFCTHGLGDPVGRLVCSHVRLTP